MRKSSIILLVLIIIASQLLPGCSTIIYGSRQDLNVNTVPPGAVARVGTQSCVTPCMLTVSRKEKSIFIQQDQVERQYRLTRSYHVGTFLFGNLLWGLFPGMIVDSASGGKIGLEDVNIVTRSVAGGDRRKARSATNDEM